MEQKQTSKEIIDERFAYFNTILEEEFIEEILESELSGQDTDSYLEKAGGENFDIIFVIKTILEVGSLVKTAYEIYSVIAKKDSLTELLDKVMPLFNKRRKSKTISDETINEILQKILDKLNGKK